MPRVISVVVSLSVVGSHCWPDAPTNRQYLAIPHQHVFIIEVQAEVAHPNRAVEIHNLREHLWNYYMVNFPKKYNDVVDFHHRSCEDIAQDLIDRVRWLSKNFTEQIPEFGCVTVRVYEDVAGNGAVVTDVPLH